MTQQTHISPLLLLKETFMHPIGLRCRSEKIAIAIERSAKADHAVVYRDGCDLRFDDQFTLDHVRYHYKAKMAPGSVEIVDFASPSPAP